MAAAAEGAASFVELDTDVQISDREHYMELDPDFEAKLINETDQTLFQPAEK